MKIPVISQASQNDSENDLQKVNQALKDLQEINPLPGQQNSYNLAAKDLINERNRIQDQMDQKLGLSNDW